MSLNLWGVVSENRANSKLATVLDRADVRAKVGELCERERTPVTGEARADFVGLFQSVAARTDVRHPDPLADGEIKRGARESHEQATCERLAAEILDGLGIEY
jgi:hypothetical protein